MNNDNMYMNVWTKEVRNARPVKFNPIRNIRYLVMIYLATSLLRRARIRHSYRDYYYYHR